jgi:hypothetical protein
MIIKSLRSSSCERMARILPKKPMTMSVAFRRILTSTAGKRNLATSATFEFRENSFETHNCPRPESSTIATREELLELYKVMVEIRRLEMACDQVQKNLTSGLQIKTYSRILSLIDRAGSCSSWNGSCYTKKRFHNYCLSMSRIYPYPWPNGNRSYC